MLKAGIRPDLPETDDREARPCGDGKHDAVGIADHEGDPRVAGLFAPVQQCVEAFLGGRLAPDGRKCAPKAPLHMHRADLPARHVPGGLPLTHHQQCEVHPKLMRGERLLKNPHVDGASVLGPFRGEKLVDFTHHLLAFLVALAVWAAP